MCTAVCFPDDAGNLYLGRNLDWTCGYGERCRIVPAGYRLAYTHLPAVPAAHAVIGMCVDAGGFPLFFDCGNDAGLAVAGLNFPGYAHYAETPQDGLANVTVSELPCWVAASFGSVEEVVRALEGAAITVDAQAGGTGGASLHWIVSDGARTVVVESMADGLHVLDDPVGVLANAPDLPWHLTNLRTYTALNTAAPQPAPWGELAVQPLGVGAGVLGLPGDACSPARFTRAAFHNTHHPLRRGERANVARMLRTLGNVAMVEGTARSADGEAERTLYTGCFSAATGTYYAQFDGDPVLYAAALAQADEACPDALVECAFAPASFDA